MAFGHRISSLGPEGGRPSSVLQTRMYDHRGKAIRAIHRALDDERLRNTDCALCIVMMLLFGEVSPHPVYVATRRSVLKHSPWA